MSFVDTPTPIWSLSLRTYLQKIDPRAVSCLNQSWIHLLSIDVNVGLPFIEWIFGCRVLGFDVVNGRQVLRT